MDQTVALRSGERKMAVKALSEFVAASVDAARAVEKPFYHLEFDRVFPAMPEPMMFMPLVSMMGNTSPLAAL